MVSFFIISKILFVATSSLSLTIEKSKFDFSRALVFIISQSGKSEDLIECHKMVKKMNAKTIIICNNSNSPLLKTANYFFDINAGEEKSVAATKTFVLSLIIIIKLVFITMGKKNINMHTEKLSDQLMLDDKNNWDPNILDKNITNGYIISRGVGYAISNEISLKFKELCQEMIEPFSSAEVMHGPKSLIQNSFKVFTISLRDNSGNIVKKDSEEITKLTDMHYEISYKNKNKNTLFYNPYEFIEFDPIIILAKFYPWIIRYSLIKGLDPDKPRYLTKVTKTF